MNKTFVLIALLALTACGTEKIEVLKSPCAGLEDGPCGPKRPANEWLGIKKPQQA